MLVDIKEFRRRLMERMNDPTVADEKWFAEHNKKIEKRLQAAADVDRRRAAERKGENA